MIIRIIIARILIGISEFIFFEPFFVTHIPSGSELGFSLIVILSILSALVIPMNLFRITHLKNSKQKIGGSIFGSIVGSIAGACSCGPIRILAIVIRVITYSTTIKSLKTECQVNF